MVTVSEYNRGVESRRDTTAIREQSRSNDTESRLALQDALADWPGGLMVVSRDRALLRLTDRIVELTPKGPKSYGGNYDLYVAQRDAEARTAREQLAAAAKELRRARRDA